MRELYFNVGGDPKDDRPYLQPDNPAGAPAIPLVFLEGAMPPNRARVVIPNDSTGGSTVYYQNGAKSFRVILPPLDHEFQAEAGEPPQLPPEYNGDADQVALHYRAATPALQRLSARGRYLYAGDQRLKWRSITGFRLLELIATGRQAEAETFARWCAENKIAPRVLTSANVLFRLTPSVGAAVLPDLLALFAQVGCYVEVVAFADSAYYTYDHNAHMRDVANKCEASGIAILEVANEVVQIHPTQDSRLGDIDYLMTLARLASSSLPLSIGSTHNGDDENRSLAEASRKLGNAYATAHMMRSNEENNWKWVRHTNELGWIADDVRIYAINDEPRRDDTTPGKHLALAVLCHGIRDIGDTFHCASGLQAQIPNGAELSAFEARKQGWDLIPADFSPTYRNSGQGWPVKGLNSGLRVYSGVQGGLAYTLVVDGDSNSPQWYDNAKPELLASRDRALVYRVTQG